MQFRYQRALCLLLMLFLMLSAMPTSFAEDTADVAVYSAPLERSAATRNGMVRVRLLSIGSNPASLTVTAVGAMAVSGGQTMALANGEQISISHSSATGEIRLTRGGETVSMGREMALRRRQTDGGFRIAQARRPQNVYPGDLHLVSKLESGTYRLYVVANVYIESYLYGVVPYEMGSSSALEALKAQAVAARTYTLRAMNANASKVYDVVDTTADQVYNGSPAERDRAAEAVDATRGIVAMNDGKLTGTYYTASNGGQTESARNAWGSSGVNYLTVKDDPFDRMNPYSSTRKMTIYAAFSHASQNQTLTRLLQAKAPDATILRIEAVTPHTPKYAAPSRLYTKLDFDVTALVDGETRRLTLTFDIFSELESALNLSINTTKNELWSVKADGETFVLTVRRYGHGIGMSQRGAQQMANLGYTYDQILGFYYENCVRMQYTFTHTILPPVGDAPVTATEVPATISPAAPNQAMGDAGECGGRAERAPDRLRQRHTADDAARRNSRDRAGKGRKLDAHPLRADCRLRPHGKPDVHRHAADAERRKPDTHHPLGDRDRHEFAESARVRQLRRGSAVHHPRRRSAVRVRGGERLGEHTVWRENRLLRGGVSHVQRYLSGQNEPDRAFCDGQDGNGASGDPVYCCGGADEPAAGRSNCRAEQRRQLVPRDGGRH